MSDIQAISRNRHASKRWIRYTNFSFAATEALATLVAQELPQAIMHLPIGFADAEGAFTPVAIQGLKPGKNLFVALDGRWLGGYIPFAYRCYPFLLVDSEDGQQVMCINEASGLLSDTHGEPFFGEDGQPSKAVADVLSFLNQVAASRQATQRICTVLQKHNLIQPWPIKLRGAEGDPAAEWEIEGLYRVDEAKLNQLAADALMELRDTGALTVAYCQLLSMQHLPKLALYADAYAQVDAKAALSALPAIGKDLDLSFMLGGKIDFLAENDIIKFC